jgi:hypothetical protein
LDGISRQIQDELFDHRKTTPLIFDSIYNRNKEEQEENSKFSTKKMVQEYLKIIK